MKFDKADKIIDSLMRGHLSERLKNRMASVIYRRMIHNGYFGSLPLSSVKQNTGLNLDTSSIDHKTADYFAEMYSRHYFDLLGSGWVHVGYEDEAFGVERFKYHSLAIETDREGDFLDRLLNPGQCKESKQIWHQIYGDYKGIDWQKDFKSGWRWGNDLFYFPRVWPESGGDIKVPWELSRLQHFPRLAIISRMEPELKGKLFSEYKNEMLDFIALNPVGWGVNYMCTMDVAIRVSNMVLSLHLWSSDIGDFSSSKGDIAFWKTFYEYVYKQCYFIYTNLEWKSTYGGNGGNHYMADIVGLIWGTSIFESRGRIKKWKEFAVSEFFSEIGRQFYPDGANKEGSIGYHRLTLEMTAYTIALLDSQGIIIDQKVWDFLATAGYYLAVLTRPDKNFTQIGDNDSGRFFKLSFIGEFIDVDLAKKKYVNLANYKLPAGMKYFDESMNDTGALLSVISTMTDADYCDYCNYDKELFRVEISIIDSLIRKRTRKAEIKKHTFVRENSPGNLHNEYMEKYEFAKKINLKKLHLYEFPFAGVVVIKSKDVYIVFNLSEVPVSEKNGHTHNDKLSVEIMEGEKCFIEDGGTYLYTALPRAQKIFKSVKNHLNVTIENDEQDILKLSGKWYTKKNQTRCFLVQAERNYISAYITYRDIIHYREVKFDENCVLVKDFSNKKIVPVTQNRMVTAGYGKLLR